MSQAGQSATAPPAPVPAPPAAAPAQSATPTAVAVPPATTPAADQVRDTPSLLRRLSLGVIVGSLFVGPAGRADLQLPRLLPAPGRGRHGPAAAGAEDPDQPADRGRHRDQRVPGRRPGAAQPAGHVRPGHDRDRVPGRRGGRGPAGGRERPVRPEPADRRLRHRRSSRPAPTTGRASRSARSTCATPARSSGAPRCPSWTTWSLRMPPAPPTRWTSGSAGSSW